MANGASVFPGSTLSCSTQKLTDTDCQELYLHILISSSEQLLFSKRKTEVDTDVGIGHAGTRSWSCSLWGFAGLEPLGPLRAVGCVCGTFAISEGWVSAKQQNRQSSYFWGCPRTPFSGDQELVDPEHAYFFQGGGPGSNGWESARNHQGGLTDVFSASASLLVLGRWDVGTRQLKTWISFKQLRSPC